MLKKAFLILATLSFVFCFSTLCLAAHVPNTITDSMHKTGNTINGAVDGVRNAAGHTTNAVNNGLTHNTPAGTTTHNITGVGAPTGTGTAAHRAGTGGYTAARTATPNTFNRTTTMWSWIIVGATVLIIGGLIWYYVSDANKTRLRTER